MPKLGKQLDCQPLPQVLDEIVSEKSMGVSTAEAQKTKEAILKADGPAHEALTCIAKEKRDTLALWIFAELRDGTLASNLQKRLGKQVAPFVDKVRGLNVNCVDCAAQCEQRVDTARVKIAQVRLDRNGRVLSPRMAKALGPDVIGKILSVAS